MFKDRLRLKPGAVFYIRGLISGYAKSYFNKKIILFRCRIKSSVKEVIAVRCTYERQSGHALFLILIAVALFAALSYAVTNSGRGSGNINKEETEIQVAQIFEYVGAIQHSVQRMQLINQCSDTELSFHYDSDEGGVMETDGSDDFYNPTASTDCYVFHPNGGGMTPQKPGQANNLVFTGDARISGVGCSGASANCSDLLIVLNNVSGEICRAVNTKLRGSGNASPVNDNYAIFPGFDGTYTAGGGGANITAGAVGYPDMGCVVSSGGVRSIYSVLIAR